MRKVKTLEERFNKFFSKKENDCWIWNGKKDHQGYGVFFSTVRKQSKAHRFMYELHFGKVENFRSFMVGHNCNNKSCVNPIHLFLSKNFRNFLISNNILTEKDVLEIRMKTGKIMNLIKRLKIKKDLVEKDLENKFKVSHKTIKNVIHRYSWTHI